MCNMKPRSKAKMEDHNDTGEDNVDINPGSIMEIITQNAPDSTMYHQRGSSIYIYSGA